MKPFWRKKGKDTALLMVAVFFSFFIFFPGNKASADSLTVSGTVVIPTGDAYTEGGNVNVYNQNNGYGSNIEKDGSFKVEGVSAGTYTIEVNVNSTSSYANPAQQQMTVTGNVSGLQLKVSNPVLKGTLAKPDGTPTSGCVQVHDSTWTVSRNSCPGDDGKWKMGSLDKGEYILAANPNTPSAYVGIEQKVTITDPTTTLDLGLIKLDSPFITGIVTLPDGSRLTWDDDYNKRLHLSVDMWNQDYTINKHSEYDKDSKFKFGKVPAGTYTIHANIWDSDTYTGSENISITVPAAGLDLTGSPLKLTTPQLVGTVYRADGVTPVQNAWVSIHNEDWSVNQGGNSDQNGKYQIGGLAAGTYKLEVNPPQDLTDIIRPDPVEITITKEKQTRNITFTVAKKFVKGTIKKKDGKAVSCAQVNANKQGGNGWANARTGADGTFSLTVGSGSWTLRVEPDRGFDCPEPDWVFMDSETLVDFSSDNSTETETVNFTVQKATSVITGKVTKKDGTLITNGNVNANSQSQDGRNRFSNAQIKSDGTYRLYMIPGTYDVNIWTQDNRLYSKNQKVTVAENQTVTLNFVMSEKLAHIKGAITTKDGKGLPNIQINGNLDCGPEGCSAWSNTKTDSDGGFDLAATAGRWFINFDSGQNSSYVYDGQPRDVTVEKEDSVVTGVDFALTYADVIIKGKVVDENDKPLGEIAGWAYIRPTTTTADEGIKEYGGPINQGTFTLRAPSKLFSQAEIGMHMPPNSQYSPSEGQTLTLVADSTVEKNIKVKKNDAAIVGRIIDSGSGLPLNNCSFRGDVFANSANGLWYGTQISKDCSFQINLLSGSYQLGYNFDQSAGFMNRPPRNEPITVTSGTQVSTDIKVLSGDAKVSVLILNPDGTPARRVWVWADNHEEVDQSRRSSDHAQGGEKEGQKGSGNPDDEASPEDMMKFCSQPENEKSCREKKLPAGSKGPGGCTDAYECTQYCKKHTDECKKEFEGKDNRSPKEGKEGNPPKEGEKTGENTAPFSSADVRKARVAELTFVKAEEKQANEEQDFFDNMLSSGGETNDLGIAVLSLVSGHEYTVSAGLPPESSYMPPKTERVSLKTAKSASVTLQLREADGKMTGLVTKKDGAVKNGWMNCWSEDGNSTGSPIMNGTYKINYTFNSTYHCDANAQDGTTFLRSDPKTVVIDKQKSIQINFTLGEAKFQVPPPVSETFDATQPHVITLGDGTTINIPANTLASSGNVTVNANPTINVQSQKTAQPLGYGYSLEASDSSNKSITTFNGNVTACFRYSDIQLEDAGIDESSLVPSYWDTSSNTWKQPSNVTHDQDNNTVCVQSDHFTSYAVVSTSGKARGQTLTDVTVQETKGVTRIKIGKGKTAKTITPFGTYRGKVSVGTFTTKKSGQLIVASQKGSTKDATVIKMYTVKGKLHKILKPWGQGYKQGLTIDVEDLTNDGYDDMILAPAKEKSVKVVDPNSNATYQVSVGQASSLIASALDVLKNGKKQLVVKADDRLKAWKFETKKKRFQEFTFDQRKVQASGSTLTVVSLKPAITSVSPNTLKSGKGTKKITIKGENFGTGSKVLINGSTPAKKVTATGNTTLEATFDGSALTKGKKNSLTVINADGEQATYSQLKVK